jgi:hypothetical protein
MRRYGLGGGRVGAHSFIHKPLEPPGVEVEVTFTVHREGMRYVQGSAKDPLLADVVEAAEILRVRAAATFPLMAELPQELACVVNLRT